jgi:hypothetical protein
MPWVDVIFTDVAQEKIAAHDVSMDEARQVLENAELYTTSRSSGWPLAQGWTRAGRWIVVVYRELDSVTWEVITAFEPS